MAKISAGAKSHIPISGTSTGKSDIDFREVLWNCLIVRSPAKLPGCISNYKLKFHSLDGPCAEFVSMKKIAIEIIAGRPPLAG